MEFHVGQKIKEIADKRHLGSVKLSRLINTSKQNIYGIFKRQSIDTQLLSQLSVALNYNFFSFYYNKFNSLDFESVEVDKKNMTNENQKIIELENRNISLSKEIDYLKEINALLKQKGKK